MTRMDRPRGTLVQSTKETLTSRITGGNYPLGGRMLSEAALCSEFGVSRTVVREAIASLRADRLVEPRQGAGVFVVNDNPTSILAFTLSNQTCIFSFVGCSGLYESGNLLSFSLSHSAWTSSFSSIFPP